MQDGFGWGLEALVSQTEPRSSLGRDGARTSEVLG